MSRLNFVKHLKGPSGKSAARPPFEGVYAYLLSALVGYGVADYAVLTVRPSMLSKSAPAVAPPPSDRWAGTSSKDYSAISNRNIFNSTGEDPPALSAAEGGKDSEMIEDQEAVLSKLPLSLEGTIVHVNPKKSVATIVVKNSNESKPFRVGEPIENLVERITKIERRKVTFINQNSRRLEYIEIPLDEKLTLSFKNTAPQASGSEEVVKRGEFDFQLKRSDVNKYLSDLSSVLGQARMQPNVPPGSGGGVEGFKFTAIQPGSVYEKLGFKVQDIIKSVNGEPVNSPTKAMEMYNSLKGQNDLELEVERNGRTEKFNYNITE